MASESPWNYFRSQESLQSISPVCDQNPVCKEQMQIVPSRNGIAPINCFKCCKFCSVALLPVLFLWNLVTATCGKLFCGPCNEVKQGDANDCKSHHCLDCNIFGFNPCDTCGKSSCSACNEVKQCDADDCKSHCLSWWLQHLWIWPVHICQT
jgi:hypothetical protein